MNAFRVLEKEKELLLFCYPVMHRGIALPGWSFALEIEGSGLEAHSFDYCYLR